MSIINPKTILKKKIVTGLLDEEKQLQPNSLDLTIKNATLIIDGGVLTENKKLQPRANYSCENMGRFEFEAGKAYDIEFNESIEVPDNVMCFITHRSSLNRIGGQITSGIYDSGFKNYLGATLRTNNKISIEKNCRIATIYFIKADSAFLYQGQYQSPTPNSK